MVGGALAASALSTASVAQTGGSVRSIDTHAHVFKRGLPLADARRYAPDYDATPEDYLKILEANGISHAVLVQPSFFGTDNGYMEEALRKYPQRFRGIAVIKPDASSEELHRLDALGVVGIRLNLLGLPDPELETGEWPDLLKLLAGLNWQVEIQAEAKRWPTLLPPLLKSGVKVVADHFGKPDPKLGTDDPGFGYLLNAGKTRQVWVKLSGPYRNGDASSAPPLAQTAAKMIRDSFGVDRLLWGSDWPHTQFEKVADYATLMKSLESWVPDANERRTVLVDTPTNLFRFPR